MIKSIKTFKQIISHKGHSKIKEGLDKTVIPCKKVNTVLCSRNIQFKINSEKQYLSDPKALIDEDKAEEEEIVPACKIQNTQNMCNILPEELKDKLLVENLHDWTPLIEVFEPNTYKKIWNKIKKNEFEKCKDDSKNIIIKNTNDRWMIKMNI